MRSTSATSGLETSARAAEALKCSCSWSRSVENEARRGASVARWYSSAPPRRATRTAGDASPSSPSSSFDLGSLWKVAVRGSRAENSVAAENSSRGSRGCAGSGKCRRASVSADVEETTPRRFAILRSATFRRRLHASRARLEDEGAPAAARRIETYDRGSMSYRSRRASSGLRLGSEPLGDLLVSENAKRLGSTARAHSSASAATNRVQVSTNASVLFFDSEELAVASEELRASRRRKRAASPRIAAFTGASDIVEPDVDRVPGSRPGGGGAHMVSSASAAACAACAAYKGLPARYRLGDARLAGRSEGVSASASVSVPVSLRPRARVEGVHRVSRGDAG